MTDELYSKLIDYAKSQVDEQVSRVQFRGGTNTEIVAGTVSLAQPGRLEQETEEEETWRLALIGNSERVSDFLGPSTNDVAVIGFIPRNTGIFFLQLRFPVTIFEDTSPPQYVRFLFNLSTRTYEPALESIPSPPVPDDWGRPYPGTIAFDLEQRKQSDNSLVSTTEIIVPPEGTTILVQASIPDTVIIARPNLASFRRVRT